MKVYRTGQGSWQLNFTFEGKYRTLYVGRKCPPHLAKTAIEVVKELLSLQDAEPLPDLLFRIGTLPERIRLSLKRFGLLRRCFGISITELYERFFKFKCYKDSTYAGYRTSQTYLVRYFGYDTSIRSISQDDIKKLYHQLSLRLSECSLSCVFRRWRVAFNFAVEEGLLSSNPFSMKVHRVDANEERQFYISRDAAFRLFPFFRNVQERLLFALGRFAGLRIPSEVIGLRFKDFDLEEKVFYVGRDTKTGARQVPFFREVRDIFVTFKGEPDEFVFEKYSRPRCRYFMERA